MGFGGTRHQGAYDLIAGASNGDSLERQAMHGGPTLRRPEGIPGRLARRGFQRYKGRRCAMRPNNKTARKSENPLGFRFAIGELILTNQDLAKSL